MGACPLLLRLDASHNDLRGLAGPTPLPPWSQHSVRPTFQQSDPTESGGSRSDGLTSSLSGCTLLQYLNLSCNGVAQLEAVLIAAPYCPWLLSLDMRYDSSKIALSASCTSFSTPLYMFRNNPLCCKHASAVGAATPQGWDTAWAAPDVGGAEGHVTPPGYLPSLLVYFPLLNMIDGRTVSPEVCGGLVELIMNCPLITCVRVCVK